MSKAFYIDNDELERELIKSQLQGKMTEKLGQMLCLMCDRMLRHVKFRNASQDIKEEMKSRALHKLVKHLVSHWSQAQGKGFSYVTHIIFQAYLTELDWQNRYMRRQKLAKDLVMQGYTQEEIYEMLYGQKDNRGENQWW